MIVILKKSAFIFLFLFIFLGGCSVEESSNVILNPPTFQLNDKYKGTLEIKLDQAIVYEENLTLFVDGKEYMDDTLRLGVGEHVLEAYVWKKKNKSEKVTKTINILDKNNKEYVEVYAEPNNDSKIKDIIVNQLIKVHEDYDYVYEFINGRLISWEEVELPNSSKGYIIDDVKVESSNYELRKNIVLRMEDGKEIVLNEKADNCWYTFNDDLSQYGYFLINKTEKIKNKESSIIVNSKTGEQYETLRDFVFSPKGKKIVAYNRMRSYFSKMKNELQILSLEGNTIKLEWTGTFDDFGIDDITWLDEENIRWLKYIPTKNEWERVDQKYKEVTEILSYRNGEWELSRLNSKEKINDSIFIYESIDQEANVIGSISENEIDYITFKNMYQLINNDVMLWFEIETDNGTKGYIYRALKDSERPYYDNGTTEFYLILKNGKFMTINDHLENSYDYFLGNELAEKGYYTLYSTYDGEGHQGLFINGDTGESFSGEGFPILSKTKNKFIIANFDLEAGFSWNGIQIFTINENEITLDYQESFNDWGPSNIQWVDDSHILFTKNVFSPTIMNYTQVKAELVLLEGFWIIRDLEE